MNFMVGERHQQDAVRATAAYGSQQEIPPDAAPAEQAPSEQPPSEQAPAEAQPAPPAEAGGS
jgi:hypothetical protein